MFNMVLKLRLITTYTKHNNENDIDNDYDDIDNDNDVDIKFCKQNTAMLIILRES